MCIKIVKKVYFTFVRLEMQNSQRGVRLLLTLDLYVNNIPLTLNAPSKISSRRHSVVFFRENKS